MIVFETRASSILFNVMASLQRTGPLLLPANVCPIVPLTLRKANRSLSLIDVNSSGFVSQPQVIDTVRDQAGQLAGVLYVRTYGAEAQDPSSFFRRLKSMDPGLLVIDDKCLCAPDPGGHRLAKGADVTLYSTGSRKYLDLGFGGFAHLDRNVAYRRHSLPFSPEDLDLAERSYKNAVGHRRYFRGTGGDWLDLSDPGLSWEQYETHILDGLPKIAQHKTRLNRIYAANLPDEIQFSPDFQNWRFNISVPGSDRLIESLFHAGLFASQHYASLGGIFTFDRFPQAEKLQSNVVNLFNDCHVDETQAERTARVVLDHLDTVASG